MKITKFRGKNGQRIVFRNDRWESDRRVWNHLKKESRTKSRINLGKEPNAQSREAVRKIIYKLEKYQPAGLVHIASLSRAIGRCIRIRHPGSNADFIMGRKSKETPIDLEFHDGHWTLRNREDPEMVRVANNDCLFEAVAAQVGLKPAEIRHRTIKEIKLNESQLARVMEGVSFVQKCENALELMLGGARYVGNSASDARRLIDNSQNGTCHPNGQRGHPRGHASHPNSADSVENYSRNGWKTGFLSRADQDLVGHLAFRTDLAQRAMDRLNDGSTNEAAQIDRRELGRDDLPLASEYRNGSASGSPQRFQRLTAVLRHHSGEYQNREADVFVHTFYPRL